MYDADYDSVNLEFDTSHALRDKDQHVYEEFFSFFEYVVDHFNYLVKSEAHCRNFELSDTEVTNPKKDRFVISFRGLSPLWEHLGHERFIEFLFDFQRRIPELVLSGTRVRKADGKQKIPGTSAYRMFLVSGIWFNHEASGPNSTIRLEFDSNTQEVKEVQVVNHRSSKEAVVSVHAGVASSTDLMVQAKEALELEILALKEELRERQNTLDYLNDILPS